MVCIWSQEILSITEKTVFNDPSGWAIAAMENWPQGRGNCPTWLALNFWRRTWLHPIRGPRRWLASLHGDFLQWFGDSSRSYGNQSSSPAITRLSQLTFPDQKAFATKDGARSYKSIQCWLCKVVNCQCNTEVGSNGHHIRICLRDSIAVEEMLIDTFIHTEKSISHWNHGPSAWSFDLTTLIDINECQFGQGDLKEY